MRILHFSDAHIGVESYGRVDPDTGFSTRLLDFLARLDEVVDYAIDSRVDLVLFAGDAYKSRDPSQTHQREFAKRIARLSSEGIATFLVVGNHDMPHTPSKATALEIFPTLDVDRVHIADRLATYRVDTGDGPLQIVALPWIRRGGFLSRDGTRGLTPDEINEEIQRSLTQIIRSQVESLDPSIPAVFAGHVWVRGATLASEQTMMLGADHMLLKSDVALPQFDYVALGHIHKHQILGHDPMVVYSGSLERVDFGEEAHEKGFCVVDIDTAAPAGQRLRGFEFRRVQARSFVTISASVGRHDLDPTQTVINGIRAHHIYDAIVRLMITLPGELRGQLRDEHIREALADAHYVASISHEVEENVRSRLGGAHARSLQPLEALKLYLGSRSVPDDRVQVLMRHAENIVNEEQSDAS